MPLNPATRIGIYEILSAIGAGGMGEVYRARDTKLGREVAIKVLPKEFTKHPQKLARFEREARLLAALNHPNIATLYGVEESEGKPFLVMELVEGETLAERIARGPLPVQEAEPRAYVYPRISPDGSQVALSVADQENDIWIWSFARNTLRRLTFDPSNDIYPAWTPDGRRVAFASAREGALNLFSKAADGTGTVERLTESENAQFPYAFSPDGKQLMYREFHPQRGGDLVVRSMDGDGSSEPLLVTEFNERNAEVSPDGRWLAVPSPFGLGTVASCSIETPVGS